MRAAGFYNYLHKREELRLVKESGAPWPWTDDPILRDYKFTNVRREHDRTTQQFKQWYGENYNAPPEVQLINCGTARFFGWAQFVIKHIGWQDRFEPRHIKSQAVLAAQKRQKIFTGAYVITNGGIPGPKYQVVVDEYLAPLWENAEALVSTIRRHYSWKEAMTHLMTLPGFGGTGFMAKEVILDTMFTNIWEHSLPVDFDAWCPLGPGARRGLNRVFGHGLQYGGRFEQRLEELKALHQRQLTHWPSGWGHLSLHDIQFGLCEFDKYERVRLGEGKPRSRYRPSLPRP